MKQTAWKKQEESIKNEESVGESGRLFIRNLSYSVTANDIEDLFKKFGPVAETNLPIGKFLINIQRVCNREVQNLIKCIFPVPKPCPITYPNGMP